MSNHSCDTNVPTHQSIQFQMKRNSGMRNFVPCSSPRLTSMVVLQMVLVKNVAMSLSAIQRQRSEGGARYGRKLRQVKKWLHCSILVNNAGADLRCLMFSTFSDPIFV